MNKITEWDYDFPTEPGDYLVCYGDVETRDSVSFRRFKHKFKDGVSGL